MICDKLRMQGNAHQATFAGGLDIGYREQRLRPKLAICENSNTAGALCEDHASVGGPDNVPGNLQVADDCFYSEVDLRIRGFYFSGAPAGRRVTAGKRKQRERKNGKPAF